MIPHREEDLCIVGFFGVNVKANGNKIEKTRHIFFTSKGIYQGQKLVQMSFLYTAIPPDAIPIMRSRLWRS